MATKLYVGGLPYQTTEEELKTLFAEHGNIISVQIIMDRDTGQSKGFAFLEFEKEEEAQSAIKALDQTDLGGRKITVNVARPKEERPRNSNYGGDYQRR